MDEIIILMMIISHFDIIWIKYLLNNGYDYLSFLKYIYNCTIGIGSVSQY